MGFQTNINTDGLEPLPAPSPRYNPPLELQPAKSPFLVAALPTTAVVNPDSIRNFNTPGIPSYRINPPAPLNAAGSVTNTIATVKTVPSFLTPTPAPTIASPLVTIPTGFQFSFNQVRLPLSSTLAISSYKVYRNSANNSASAKVIQAIPHHPAGVGVPVVVQDNQVNGVVAFYWVSAVSTSGQESTLTPAQTSGVTSNAIANANSQIASSAHMNTLNVNFVPLAGAVLTNDGTNSFLTVVANQVQFAFGQVSYNSGTIAPSGFGNWFVFADDPQFQGGAVVYQASNSPALQVADDGRMNFGSMKTALGSTATGGGFSGGTTGLSGGRGFALANN